MPARRAPMVFIVSDGRGDTAAQVLKAAAVQFEGRPYRVSLRAGVRTPEEVNAIVHEARRAKAIIFYTLVEEEVRRTMRRASGRELVPTVDILGPCFSALADQFGSRRGATPGLLFASDRDRLERMAAIDYTLAHDDGRRPHELNDADVVLVGVSRASKSSTGFYLAYAGIRAANVPLIPGLALPPELEALPAERVVGLRVNVDRLLTVRAARAGHLGEGVAAYVDRRAVAREVIDANRVMEAHGWRSVDVSYLAVEEIAREVVQLRKLGGKRAW